MHLIDTLPTIGTGKLDLLRLKTLATQQTSVAKSAVSWKLGGLEPGDQEWQRTSKILASSMPFVRWTWIRRVVVSTDSNSTRFRR